MLGAELAGTRRLAQRTAHLWQGSFINEDGTMTNETAIAAMVDRIVRRCQPSCVVLFGSQARGTANEWSDVDMLVVVGDAPDKRRAAVEIRRLLGDMPVSKDIVVTTPDEIARRGHMVGTVLHAALREGKVVYDDPAPEDAQFRNTPLTFT